MVKLISITDIIEFKPLSINMDVAKKLDPFIIEAQEFDLKEVLGDPLYIALINDAPNFGVFGNLFNPLTYAYSGNQYQHQGIKASLIYFAYARFLINSNTNATSFGMVVKKNDYSEPVDGKTLAMQIKQAKSGAIAYQNMYIDYLNRNSDDYPLWRIGACSNEVRGTSINVRKIGK